MLKIIGAGLSKTGTHSLAAALTQLGYQTLHWAPERLRGLRGDFRRYDDVDAVTDIPAALFYRELLDAYPGSVCILTVRPVDDWLRSVRHHYENVLPGYLARNPHRKADDACWTTFAYGGPQFHPYLWRKRYEDHNRAVRMNVEPRRLLVLNFPAGDGWAELCAFLGRPVPATPFPHANRTH